MKIKLYLFATIATFISCLNSLKAQDTILYTLQTCIDLAIQHNLTLAISNNQLENSKIYLNQAKASMLPTISGYANQGISNGKSINPYTNTFINQEVNTGQYGLNGTFTLFNGFANANTLMQKTHTYRASLLDVEQIKIDICSQVIVGYLQILNNQELLRQAKQQLEVTQLQIARLNNLEKNNAITPSVLYDTKAQLANDKINIININASLQTAKLNLAQLLNISFPTYSKFQSVELQKTVLTQVLNTEALMSEGIKNAPSLKSFDFRRKSMNKAVQAAYGLFLPSINFNANIGSNFSSAAFSQKTVGSQDIATDAYVTVSGINSPVIMPQSQYETNKIPFTNQLNNNLNTYIGLSLQVPIFNGLRNRTQLKIAQLNNKQTQEQQKNAELRYKIQIEQTTNDLIAAKEKYIIVTEQLQYYTDSYRIATAKFENGSLTTLEFISSKTNYEKTKASLIMAQYDCILKEKLLEIYTKGKISY